MREELPYPFYSPPNLHLREIIDGHIEQIKPGEFILCGRDDFSRAYTHMTQTIDIIFGPEESPLESFNRTHPEDVRAHVDCRTGDIMIQRGYRKTEKRTIRVVRQTPLPSVRFDPLDSASKMTCNDELVVEEVPYGPILFRYSHLD